MSQNHGDIQERIAAARREAESLREKIRAKRAFYADADPSWMWVTIVHSSTDHGETRNSRNRGVILILLVPSVVNANNQTALVWDGSQSS
ncbi:hypothetical protein C8R45DRAFT_492825 [Mycena sanguinolenta]|nr:hypothetical protein C8R45DRAFT_492825 [Mycena sanguinolenta]